MARHSRRGRDDIADVGRVERGEIALAERRQHLRECLESHRVDRQTDQIRDQERFVGGMTADPLDAGHVVKGVGGVAVGRLTTGVQHEQAGRRAQRLHLRQQHVDGWSRPVPLEPAGVAIGGAADQVERGGMSGECFRHGRIGHVVRCSLRERRLIRFERGIGVECREGLLVERGGILHIGHGRRQVGLHELRRFQPQVGALCRHGVVDEEERAKRHGLGHHESRRQADDGPAGGQRYRVCLSTQRLHVCPGKPRPNDPDAADEGRQKRGERGTEPVGRHGLPEGEKCRERYERRERSDGRAPGHGLEQPPQPGTVRPRRGGRAGGRPEQA